MTTTEHDAAVEAVARAIQQAHYHVGRAIAPPWPDDRFEQERWRGMARAALSATPAVRDDSGEVARLREELAWYGEQARLARLIHSEGDAGRNELAADGGKRARAALEPRKGGE